MTSFVRFEIDQEKLKKYGLKARQIRRAQRHALETMARGWHDDYLPLHFSEQAYERYRYTRRKGMGLDPNGRTFRRSYTARKLRERRHNRPLIYTGDGATQALGPVRLRGTDREQRVILPSKFNFKHPKSRVSMRDELTRVLPEETRDLVERARRAFRQHIADAKNQ